MRMIGCLIVLVASLFALPVGAQCAVGSIVPLTNGMPANAADVMKNFNIIFSCPPKVTVLTGSGTYTPGTGAVRLQIRMVGGGGGGGGSGSGAPGNGGAGVASTFSGGVLNLVANGGGPGPNPNGGGFVGGAGGTASGCDVNSTGVPGMNNIGNSVPDITGGYGTNGGASALGGGGPGGYNGGAAGFAGAQYGGGGGGAGGLGGSYRAATGGGGGAYCEKVTSGSLLASYSYTVGAGGVGGAGGGGNPGTGGAGAAGVIIVTEHYY